MNNRTRQVVAGVAFVATTSVAAVALSGAAVAWEPKKPVEFIIMAGGAHVVRVQDATVGCGDISLKHDRLPCLGCDSAAASSLRGGSMHFAVVATNAQCQ